METNKRPSRVAYPNRDVDLIIRQTYEKLHIVFIAVKNQGIEIQELRKQQKELCSLVLTLVADPQAREDAMAVIKKWNQERTQ